jgi:hypothetical protein
VRTHLVRSAPQLNTQLTPQFARAAARRRGLGAPPEPTVNGLPDFQSIINSYPQAAGVWNQLSQQLTAEGGDLAGASQDFYNTWVELSANTGMDPGDLANACGAFLMNKNTVAGAIQNVEGLIQGATSGNTAEIVQSFTGILQTATGLAVGAATAAGSVSFGVGAVIVAAVALAALAIDSLFGNSGPQTNICGSTINGQPPNFVVGCVWTWGSTNKNGRGDPYWRTFPEPSNPNDAWWFTRSANASSTQWQSGKSNDWWGWGGGGSDLYGAVTNAIHPRPIDAAFPQYHQLECDVNAASIVAALPDDGGTVPGNALFPAVTYSASDVVKARFILAYFAAWKANQEYALNGLTPKADDGNVLLVLLQFWQKAHPSTTTTTITPFNSDVHANTNSVISPTSPCAGTFSNEGWYVSMLLNPLVNGNLGNGATLPSNISSSTGAMTINTGQRLTPTGPLAGNPILALFPVGKPDGAPATLSAKNVVIGSAVAVGAGLLGAFLYARHKRTTTKAVLKTAWQKTGGRVHVPKLPKLGKGR